MKRYLFIILSLFLTAGAWAGTPVGVVVENVRIRKAGQTVVVSLDVNAEKLKRNYKAVITPVLHNGTNLRQLDEIIVTGRRRNLYEIRNQTAGESGHVIKKGNPKIIRYQEEVPYLEWMHTVSLSVDIVTQGCNCENDLPAETLAADRLLYYPIDPAYNKQVLEYRLTDLEKYSLENPFLHPVEDHPGRYDILFNERDKGTSVIRFAVGSHKIDMDIAGNRELLDAVGQAFRLIEQDPNATLKQIVIAGYASPEGTLAGNTALAQRRAEAFKKYLQGRFDIPAGKDVFELYNGREDWNGLRKLVTASDMEYRREVLDIIDAYTVDQEIRKSKLKQLGGGAPYAYMLKNFYPSLRNAGYLQIYYDIDRTASIATAVTDENGRTTWVDPDSPENIGVTRINQAIRSMMEGDYESALQALESQQGNPEAFNYIGVCHMMKGDYDRAEAFFRKAETAGDVYAPVNLGHIRQAKRVEI